MTESGENNAFQLLDMTNILTAKETVCFPRDPPRSTVLTWCLEHLPSISFFFSLFYKEIRLSLPEFIKQSFINQSIIFICGSFKSESQVLLQTTKMQTHS